MSTEAEREEAVDSFSRSLADLTVNSKPFINFLTMVAEENSSQAEAIVRAVNEHLKKVPCIVKLPILYLIDSIMKNVRKDYIRLFTPILVNCFPNIYAEADKKTQQLLEKLRQTWSEIISPTDLATLDVQVHAVDSVPKLTTESLDALKTRQIKILLNPSFLPQVATATTTSDPKTLQGCEDPAEVDEAEVLREQLLLQKKMRELEREQKQVDSQLSQMKEKFILVDNMKKSATDPLCYTTEKDKFSDGPEIPDVKPSESQADSTTTDKAPRLDNNPDALTNVPVTEEVAVSNKRISGDLVQLLTDLIAKENLRLKRQDEEGLKNYREHRSLNRGHDRADSRNRSRYSDRSYRSSHHGYKSSDRRHRYSSHKDDKYHHKRSHLSDYDLECAQGVRNRSDRSPHNLSSSKDKTLDSKQGDRHQLRASSDSSTALSNLSVPGLECTKDLPNPGNIKVGTDLQSKFRGNDYKCCPLTSTKRKLDCADPECTSATKAPCISTINCSSTPVGEQQLSVIGNNPNHNPKKFKPPLLPTPNIEPSPKIFESFSHICVFQSHAAGMTQNERRDIELYRHAAEFSYTRESSSRTSNQSGNSSTKKMFHKEVDYNHGFESSKIEQATKLSIVGFQSEQPLPVHPLSLIPPTAAIERNLRPGSPACSFRMSGQRQDFYTGALQEHLQKESVENALRSLRVNRELMMEDSPISLPPASHYVLDKIAQDTIKTTLVDKSSKAVRFYGEIALINSGESSPREILFKPGEASIIVNNTVINCAFHHPAKEVATGGRVFRVRLGAPTRELYVNDEWFQCPFNYPAKKIQLSTGEILAVQLYSNVLPLVHIGAERRDLVAGHVTLIIDAVQSVQIFLDAKPQRFDIDGVPHILKFADALQTVLVNDYPVNMQFGGPPIFINIRGTKHHIQLSALPPGIVPGKINIISMACVKAKPHEVFPVSQELFMGLYPFQKKAPFPRKGRAKGKRRHKPRSLSWNRNKATPTDSINHGNPTGYEELGAGSSVGLPFCDEEVPHPHPNINVHALFQSLCNVGLVQPQRVPNQSDENLSSSLLEVYTVDFKEPSSLKRKQPGIVDILYAGLQCSSCGVRFSTEHTEVFRKHLDWHFYQNHRTKFSEKCHNREWYCNAKLWVHLKGVEDKPHIEDEHEIFGREESSVPSHDFPQGVVCELCGDKFDDFFNEDQDEWHLRDCVLHEGRVFHPICMKDCQISGASAVKADDKIEKYVDDCLKKNLDSEETFIGEVGDCDLQISMNVSSGIIPAEKLSQGQGPGETFSLKSDIGEEPLCTNLSDKNETLQCESSQSAASSVAEPKSDRYLIEINDLQTVITECVYSCVEAVEGIVSPTATQIDTSNIKESIFSEESSEDLNATRGNGELEHTALKPKLIGRKLSQLPQYMKGSETSNLCALS